MCRKAACAMALSFLSLAFVSVVATAWAQEDTEGKEETAKKEESSTNQTQLLVWSFGGGLFNRSNPLSTSSGMAGMGIGMSGGYGIAGAEVTVNDRAFFENKAIEPQNVPSMEAFIRSQGDWRLNVVGQFELRQVLSWFKLMDYRGQISTGLLLPNGKEKGGGVVLRAELESYSLPDSTSDPGFTFTTDPSIYLGAYAIEGHAGIGLYGGIGSNSRLDRPFEDNIDNPFNRWKFAAIAQTATLKDAFKISGGGWLGLLKVQAFGQILHEWPIQKEGHVVLSDGSMVTRVRPDETSVVFGLRYLILGS